MKDRIKELIVQYLKGRYWASEYHVLQFICDNLDIQNNAFVGYRDALGDYLQDYLDAMGELKHKIVVVEKDINGITFKLNE